MAEVAVDFQLNFDEVGAKRITREMQRWRTLSREVGNNLRGLRNLSVNASASASGIGRSSIGASNVLAAGSSFNFTRFGAGGPFARGANPILTTGAGVAAGAAGAFAASKQFINDGLRGAGILRSETGGSPVYTRLPKSERKPGFWGNLKQGWGEHLKLAAAVTTLYGSFTGLQAAVEGAQRALENMATAEKTRTTLKALPGGAKYLTDTPMSPRMNVALRGAAYQTGAEFSTLRQVAAREALQPHLFGINKLYDRPAFKGMDASTILARMQVGAELQNVNLQMGLQAAAQEINKGAAMTDESLGTIARGFGPHITSKNLLGVDRGTLRRLFLPETDPNAMSAIKLPLVGGGFRTVTRQNLPTVVNEAVRGFVRQIGGGQPIFANTGMPSMGAEIDAFPESDLGLTRRADTLDEAAGQSLFGSWSQGLGREWERFGQSLDQIILRITMDEETRKYFRVERRDGNDFEVPVGAQVP